MPSYVVVGASRGIGLEFVRQLAASLDNEVFAIVRNKSTSANLTPFLATNVHLLEADVTDFGALKTAAAEVARITHGTVDVLIHNAAYTEREKTHFSLDDYPEDQLDEDLLTSFNVNVIGPIHAINAFLPFLRQGKTKKIITLTSGRGDPDFTYNTGLYDSVPYSISKAGTNMVNAKYAAKFKDEGFVFLALSPGMVRTSDDAPKTDAQMQHAKTVLQTVLAANPDFEGPLTPEQSVKIQLGIIERATTDNNGQIMSHHGDRNWL